MADTPISALPPAASVAFNDQIPLVNSGKTVTGTPAQIIAAVRREGSVRVPADGTPFPILFTPGPFPHSVGPIRFGLEDYSGDDNAALSSPRVVSGSKTVEGFTVVVYLGAPGSDVLLHFEASGT